MKTYDLIIRTKKNKRLQSVIAAEDYEAAKEKIEIVLSENTFVICSSEKDDYVFLAVSEIGYITLKNNPEN